MAYIREHYKVPAKRGARVRYFGQSTSREGTIVGSDGQYLIVRFDDIDRTKNHPTTMTWRLHPTWCLEYVSTERMSALPKEK
jgi:hypothetical protein